MDFSKLKDLYVSETEDCIQALNKNLLALEKDTGNKELLNELMRFSHTIKGSSATMGFESMAFLAHVLEDVFDYARHDLISINSSIINVSFDAVDGLEKSLKSVQESDKETDLASVTGELKKITGVATEGWGKSLRGEDGTPALKAALAESSTPPPEKDVKLEDFQQELPVGKEGEKLSNIKVPVGRLDTLMDLTEELLVDKMRLEMILKSAADNYKNLSDIDFNLRFPLARKFRPVTDHLARLVSDLQFQVMQIRMVPVEQVFNRFPRMIRDLAEKQGKEIDFFMSGGEMELDRTIVDKLGEPLVHLLRNAVDHGISKKGTIRLKAVRQKEFALISVENTGNSIDIEKIKNSAVKKGVITEDEAQKLNEKQILHLLFNPCFSTAEKVTATSGRGVGLSVVKQFADHVNGHVTIEPSIEGGGSRFTLELPFTLAIIRALLVRVNKEVFAIPFTSVEKSVRVPIEMIKSIADKLISLREYFNVPVFENVYYGADDNAKVKQDNLLLVLVRRGKEMAGIEIDEIVGQQEIIVKPLPPVLRNSRIFSGSSILGDGKIILILDIVSLLEEISRKNITTTLF